MIPVIKIDDKSPRVSSSPIRLSDVIFSGEPPSAEDLTPADLGLREILTAVCEVRSDHVRVFAIGR
jgi:hypothetical protein